MQAPIRNDEKPRLIIEARAVRKEYDTGKVKVTALKEVSLSILLGEVVAIMGPSGCGKTTLLNCLSGLDSVTSGTIQLAGQDMVVLQKIKSQQIEGLYELRLRGKDAEHSPFLCDNVSCAVITHSIF